jgi:AcrR family transcriptional regulator
MKLDKPDQETHPAPKSARGRPRDPDLEDRVFDAVMQIYSEGGWTALTFEAVARSSGVGKSSLYRRWDDRQALLRSALQARWLPVHNIDTGSLQSDLENLAEMIFASRTGEFATVENWFLVDGMRYADVRGVTLPFVEATVLQARAIVRRAAKRGEVPTNLNPGMLLDLIVGAVNNHVLTTPRHLRSDLIEKAPEFITNLIDIVMRGVQAN